MKRLLIGLIALSGFTLMTWAENDKKEGGCKSCAALGALEKTSTGKLSKSDRKILEHQAADEKMAQDLYAAFSKKWELPVFSHIQRCEARHGQVVAGLADQFGLKTQPGNKPGKFQDPETEKLYTQLLERGSASRAGALQAAAYVEEFDLAALNQALEGSSNEALQAVFSRLKHASSNHLRAFVTNLEAEGVQYHAQLLDQQEVCELLAGAGACGKGRGCGKGGCDGAACDKQAEERSCKGACKGKGQGKGAGKGRGEQTE